MHRKLAILTLVTFLATLGPASAAASKPKPSSTLQAAWSYLISLFLPSIVEPPAETPQTNSSGCTLDGSGRLVCVDLDHGCHIDPFGVPAC